MKNSSYQNRVNERDAARKEAIKGHEFERMFKNYIKAVKNNQLETQQNCINWFLNHSTEYAQEMRDFLKNKK